MKMFYYFFFEVVRAGTSVLATENRWVFCVTETAIGKDMHHPATRKRHVNKLEIR
jgi:hypothetical protein